MEGVNSNSENERSKLFYKFQMGNEGVSFDYTGNQLGVIRVFILELKELTSEKQNEELSLRQDIIQIITNFPTYTEYTKKGKGNRQNALQNFLSEKGKRIVKKLDEIALEIRKLSAMNAKKLDVDALLELVQEGINLVDNQDKAKGE